MIAWIIKSALCLGLLLGVYYLLLEKEKMHRFNRFYLLFALVFGLSIPLLNIEILPPERVPELWNSPVQNSQEQVQVPVSPEVSIQETKPEETTAIPVGTILWAIYGAGVIVMASRFVYSITKILTQVRGAAVIKEKGVQLVLMDEPTSPYSFLHYVFIHKQEYKDGEIRQEILDHEITHVKQRHTLDILLIEVLKVLLWFNPVLWLYKRAIQLNHEFLADERVAEKTGNIRAYQQLLLHKLSWNKHTVLSSSFNQSFTKKRFIMMKRTRSGYRAVIRQILVVPVLGLAVLAFSTHAEAQDVKKASVEELVQELKSKIDQGQTLTAKEKKMLQELVAGVKEVVPPPPPSHYEVDAMSEDIQNAVRDKIEEYKSLYEKYIQMKGEEAAEEEIKQLETELNEAQRKINEALRRAVEVKGQKSPPPPPFKKEQLEQLKSEKQKHIYELRRASQAYNKLEADSVSMKELKQYYQKVMEAYDNYNKANSDYWQLQGIEAAPPPPLPLPPEQRKKQN